MWPVLLARSADALSFGPDVLNLLAGAREQACEKGLSTGRSVLDEPLGLGNLVLGALLISRHVPVA
jgi:hypothetical protein